MKNKTRTIKLISIVLAGSILLTSCASTTLIQSKPRGAKAYIDGEPVGTSPYTYRDTKIIGSTTMVKLEKDGYETFNTSFSRNEEVDIGAIIGGFLVLVPFLWTMKYKPTHTYELHPISENKLANNKNQQLKQSNTTSRVEKLLKLKKLLDEKAITQEEYENLKKEILKENK